MNIIYFMGALFIISFFITVISMIEQFRRYYLIPIALLLTNLGLILWLLDK